VSMTLTDRMRDPPETAILEINVGRIR